jgi:hypothetical protein
MLSLSAAEMLEVWERGQKYHAIDRALLLASLANSSSEDELLADLPVGVRDARILELRAVVMGANISAVINCPNCSEMLEFSIDSRELGLTEANSAGSEPVEVGSWKFRIPTSRDLARVVHIPDTDNAAAALLKSCWVSDGSEAEPDWSNELMEAVENRMEELDPQGDLNLDFSCEHCGHNWQAAFDISEVFWGEVDVYAKRLFLDVHLLASAYGWTEPDVLKLSDTRRAAYINMVMS